MGKIALYQNTSLDGVMQSPDRGISDARGRRGEHDLCTCHGGRVLRTLGSVSRGPTTSSPTEPDECRAPSVPADALA